MTTRFASNVFVLLAGSFLVAASLGFGGQARSWVAFAVGALVVLAVLVAFAFRGRGVGQRIVDVAMGVTGGWVVVSSRTFDAVTVKWLAFSAGATLVVLAFAGLVVHEVLLEIAARRAAVPQADGRVTDVRERGPVGMAS